MPHVHAAGLALPGQIRWIHQESGHARKRGAPFLPQEKISGVHGKNWRVAGYFRDDLVDGVELLWLRIRQRSNEDAIDHGKYGGVRADSHSKRENGDRREAGALAHHAQAETNVVQELLEKLSAARLAAFF